MSVKQSARGRLLRVALRGSPTCPAGTTRSGFRSLARCRDSHPRRRTRDAAQASGKCTGSGGCQVTTSERQARPVQVGTPPGYRKGSLLADWLSTTDHKVIGHLYLITSFGFFLIGGIMAMVMRAQLMGPNNHRSRGSAPSAPRSTCTTRTSSPVGLVFASRPAQLPRRMANPTRTGDPDVRVLFTRH